MPIYEYLCRGCGEEFETLVRASAPAPECPACHGQDLTKKLSAFAAISVASAAPPAPPCGGCANPGTHGGCPYGD
ncbi:MAG: zinc ribbon domain-containing protein [Betaproteobacteria bacterium]|nr:zinc ribbon domain-containing protein [Betaproteobacteria bacterium]